MRLVLSILLGGIVIVACLFLGYLNLKTEGTFAQSKQDLEISKDITIPKREIIDNAENSNIQEMLQKLYSSNEKVRFDARIRIIKLAKKSDLERKRVIDSILSSLDIPNIQYGMINPKNYEGWQLAVIILGEIKASEALPNLIQCLKCNDGMGGLSLYRYPVAYAISLIGEVSVPYLEKSLQDLDQDNTTRLCAILALDSIGGEESRRVLENALLTEKRKSFRTMIKKSLEKHQTINK